MLAQKKTYTALVDAAKKGLLAGSGTRTDIDDAQARLDMSLAQELEARQNQDLTRRQLQMMINQPVLGLAKLNVAVMKLVGPDPASLDEWHNGQTMAVKTSHALILVMKIKPLVCSSMCLSFLAVM